MKISFLLSVNTHSGMKVSVMQIVLFVFASFVINAQNKIQIPINQHDTVSSLNPDSCGYQLIRFNFIHVCPIEMVDFPDSVTETKTTRDWDTGEMTMTQTTLRGFKLSKYEVTQLQWETVMGTNPSHHKGDFLPVENVSYNDVQAFINKLNKGLGTKYYLPTENQWHNATDCDTMISERYAGTKDKDELHKYAWYIDNSSGKTHRAGTRLPNARGMFDMNGNVSEWCLLSQIAEDDQYINKNLPDSVQVIIGGSWASEADNCNHDKRKICHVNYKSNDLGFRLAHEQ